LVTDNGANIIKSVRLLQDAGRENVSSLSAGSDSDSSEDEDQELRDPMDLIESVQREEEEAEILDARLKEEVEIMGKKRGKCFRYGTVP
jgi:hypothetical protein